MPKRADSVLLRVLGALAPVSLHAAAILLGWALVTEGVARLSVPEVRLVSAGLLLLSLAGWSHLRALFGAGLYALTRGGTSGRK